MNVKTLLKNASHIIPDSLYLRLKFFQRTGRLLSLKHPKSFNEKLQWIKLYDRNPIYTQMVDKYAVKDLVSEKIGSEYIIPTLGIWERFDDIDFDALPNQFVLKCTHDSGGLVICKDKSKLDISAARKKIEGSLRYDYFWHGREWPYKNVPHRILAEKYMEDQETQELRDYKIYTFEGKAMICMINQNRGIDTRADYFDREFHRLDLTWGYKRADVSPKKPRNFERMFELAEVLCQGTHELRVDFYEVDGHIYFGELTFFDGSGFDRIEPNEWNIKLGSWVNLP